MDRLDLKFSPLKWLLLFSLVCILLTARFPDPLLHPTSLVVEEGTMLFQDVYNLSFLPAVFTPYAGYSNAMTRLLAEVGRIFPYAWMPLIYTVLALGGAATALSLFYLPNFRHIVADDGKRFAACIILCAAPNAFPLMRLETLHFFFVLVLLLVAVMEWPRTAAGKLAVLLPSALCAWSSPSAVVLAPVFLYRALRRNASKFDRGVALLIVTAFVTYTAAAFRAGRPPHTPFRIMPAVYWHGFAFRVGAAGLLGNKPAWELVSRFGWYGALPLLLLVAALAGIAVIGTRRLGQSMFPVVAILWVLFSTAGLIALRPEFAADFFNFCSTCGYVLTDRFYYPATLALFLLLGILWSRLGPKWSRRIGVLGLGWAGCLYGWGYTFYPWTHSGPPFSEAAKTLVAIEKQAAADGKVHKVYLPIAPEPWFMTLYVNPAGRSWTLPTQFVVSPTRFTDHFDLLPRAPGDPPGFHRSTWFGTFDDSQYPWLLNTKYGWMSIEDPMNGGFWMYSKDLGHFWINALNFPRAYSTQKGDWIVLPETGAGVTR